MFFKKKNRRKFSKKQDINTQNTNNNQHPASNTSGKIPKKSRTKTGIIHEQNDKKLLKIRVKSDISGSGKSPKKDGIPNENYKNPSLQRIVNNRGNKETRNTGNPTKDMYTKHDETREGKSPKKKHKLGLWNKNKTTNNDNKTQAENIKEQRIQKIEGNKRKEKLDLYGISEEEIVDYYNRFSIVVDKEEEESKKSLFKRGKKKLLKGNKNIDEIDRYVEDTNKEEEIHNRLVDEDIRIIRKEITNKAPLYNLSLFNKIKVVYTEYMRYSGKAKKRAEELARKADEEKIRYKNRILTDIKDAVSPILQDGASEIYVSIGIPADKKIYLNDILQDKFFTAFMGIEEIKSNPNYKAYDVKIPVILKLTRNMEEEI